MAKPATRRPRVDWPTWPFALFNPEGRGGTRERQGCVSGGPASRQTLTCRQRGQVFPGCPHWGGRGRTSPGPLSSVRAGGDFLGEVQAPAPQKPQTGSTSLTAPGPSRRQRGGCCPRLRRRPAATRGAEAGPLSSGTPDDTPVSQPLRPSVAGAGPG